MQMTSQSVGVRTRGFTLLELLVAISVLAVVSVMAWRGLESLVSTRERLEPEAEDVRVLLTTFGQMEIDLAQVASARFVPFQGSPVDVGRSAGGGLEVLRMAPVADGETTRVQRVRYEVVNGELRRRATAPTRTLGAESTAGMQTVTLLTGVRSLRVRVWQDGAGWADPDAEAPAAPVDPGNPDAAVTGPKGIEVTIERADGVPFRRVLLVG
jgi:general secretion pathway protein J